MFGHACKLGCEGIVSKQRASPYRSGRTKTWIKVKKPGQPGNDASMGRVTTRRFPSPRSVRELEQAFRIEDANGQAVAYTSFNGREE